MAAILKMLKYQTKPQFDLRHEQIVPNCARKGIFHGDDVIGDVTAWSQIQPSIFLYKLDKNIFQGKWKTKKNIIIKIAEYMYDGIGAIRI